MNLPANFFIQKVTISHAEEIFDILWRVYNEQPKGFPMGGSWTRSLLKTELEEGDGIGVFNASHYLKAFALYRSTHQALDISVLATCPTQRKQGLMTAVLSSLKSLIQKDQEIWVDVHAENHPAIRLYQSQGFQQLGLRQGYYRDGGDAFLFTWAPEEVN